MITNNMKKVLAELIARNLKKNFEVIHLSGNLADTIFIEETLEGYKVHIPAQMYDLKEWNKSKVIIYTDEGSYAQKVNITGGFSKLHKHYVEQSIFEAIDEWKHIYRLKGVKTNEY